MKPTRPKWPMKLLRPMMQQPTYQPTTSAHNCVFFVWMATILPHKILCILLKRKGIFLSNCK
jgi:hypothetical protein